MTPHINAEKNAFASVVVMPGDPLRAKFIAEQFLEDAKLVTDVRNMLGFTGYYRNKRISVMGSGMGIPSISIYARELFVDYGVHSIIRTGSCGSIHSHINVGDMIVGMGACTDSNVNRARFNQHDFAAIADFDLLYECKKVAESLEKKVLFGNVMTTDLFYGNDPAMLDIHEKMGILGLEMEAAGLYGIAAEYGKKALALFTVSDHIRKGDALSAEKRQNSFTDMMSLALDTAARLD